MLRSFGLVALIFTAFTFLTAATFKTHQTLININAAFIPSDLSTEMNAYVVISGVLPNSCYRFDHAEVTDITPTLHEVRGVATVSQAMCLMVLIPYSQKVSLGRWSSGEHILRFVNGDGTYFERTMTVAKPAPTNG